MRRLTHRYYHLVSAQIRRLLERGLSFAEVPRNSIKCLASHVLAVRGCAGRRLCIQCAVAGRVEVFVTTSSFTCDFTRLRKDLLAYESLRGFI